MATAQFIQTAYIAFFNRPADVPGFNHWLNYPGPDQDLLNEFANSAEYLSDFAGMSNASIIDRVYQNLFSRAPEATGLSYWAAQMDAGYVTIANVAWEILNGAQNEDQDTVVNKTAAAQSFTDALVTTAQQEAYNNAGANGEGGTAKAWLATVNYSDSSVVAAQAGLSNLVQVLVDANTGGGPGPGSDEIIWGGGSGDPTILGSLTGNTTFVFQTGQLGDNTILDGRGGNNTLDVTIRTDSAIAPTTYNIQKVIARVQEGSLPGHHDNNVTDYATIDADRFHGVNVWENRNSRADLKIEDIRIQNNEITKDITFIFRESDPGHVDYVVYFDQSSLRNQTVSSGVLRAALFDSVGATMGRPLDDNPYSVIGIRVDGTLHYVDFGIVRGDATFADLQNAIQTAINADPALAAYNISVNLIENVVYMVPNETAVARADATYYLEIVSVGHTVEEGGWGTASGFLPPAISTQGRQDSSNPTVSDLVTSTAILDYVGRGSMGGDLVIGGLSVGYTSASKGVQQFDISVQRDSRLEVIASTHNTLQVVNLVNDGTYNYYGAYERDSNKGARYGDLKVFGNTNVDTIFGVKEGGLDGDPSQFIGDQHIDGLPSYHHTNGYGFTDVRVINAGSFLGNLTLNAILTEECVAKYMNLRDQAPAVASSDNVNFRYDLGSGNDVFQLAMSADNMAKFGTVTREDFVLNINAGGGDDVITTAIYDPADMTLLANAAGGAAHWYTNHQANANLTINAGSGNNVINTMGSGDWTIKLGNNGSDTYYADNTAAKAVWVFNTTDQDTAVAVNPRELNNIQGAGSSGRIFVNDGYTAGGNVGFDPAAGEMSGLHGLKLRVVYADKSLSDNEVQGALVATGQGYFFSDAVAVPTAANNQYMVTDLNINQAIKLAINGDQVLSKLLVAEDGPDGALVVTSKVDGACIAVEDLQIEFAIPNAWFATDSLQAWGNAIGAITTGAGAWTGADLHDARVASFNMLLSHTHSTAWDAGMLSDFNDCGPNPGSTYSDWYAPNNVGQGLGRTDYGSAFANQGAALLEGAHSTHTSNNVIIVNGSNGDKNVIVLSTGANCTDVIKWEGFNNGLTTIVNFESDGAALGQDLLDFTSYNAKWLGVATSSTLNGYFVDPATGWDRVGDVRGEGGAPAANVVTGVGLPNIGAGPFYYEDWTNLAAGDRYITMTRPDQTQEYGGLNPHWNTIYEIRLYTVVGTHADAFAENLVAGDARDTYQVIGFVDLGRDIDGYNSVDSIMTHIDYIPG